MAQTHCYRVRKPMQIGADIREPGDLVPELASWPGHIQARILQTEFAVLTTCDEEELAAALAYCEPEVYAYWGVEPLLDVVYGQVVQKTPEELAEADAAVQAILDESERAQAVPAPTDAEVAAVSQSSEDFELEMLDEPETLISETVEPDEDAPAPEASTREQLEELPWEDLKELAKEHPDLKGNSPKALIIDTLAKE